MHSQRGGESALALNNFKKDTLFPKMFELLAFHRTCMLNVYSHKISYFLSVMLYSKKEILVLKPVNATEDQRSPSTVASQ